MAGKPADHFLVLVADVLILGRAGKAAFSAALDTWSACSPPPQARIDRTPCNFHGFFLTDIMLRSGTYPLVFVKACPATSLKVVLLQPDNHQQERLSPRSIHEKNCQDWTHHSTLCLNESSFPNLTFSSLISPLTANPWVQPS